VDIVDQTMLSLLDGVDHGAATVVTLGTTMAARRLWNRIRRRARRTGQPLGEEERELLASEPGQTVSVAALRRLLQAMPRNDLPSPQVYGQYFNIGGDYVVGSKEHIEGDKNVFTINMSGPAADNSPGSRGAWAEEAASRSGPPGTTRCDVGVITVLSEETSAVTTVLSAAGSCRYRIRSDGLRFCEADVNRQGQNVTVAAMQTLDRGQRAAALAFEQLRHHYAPTTVVLVGIAGGINPAVRIGDVVVAQEVIYYDLRKEQPGRTVHRGQARPVPATTRRAINAFFSDHGEPYLAAIQDPDGTTRTCGVLPGPIGSGEAVVACEDSEIRRYLTSFNDKTLALETEAGGLAEAFYETVGSFSPGTGWLAVRGISDHADARKDDSGHQVASWHAAAIFMQLLPYLKPAPAE
jgi:adenosylhomocysteine nucleosidase